MPDNSNTQKSRKDREVFLTVNIAYTLNFITKKTAGVIFKKYKKTGSSFDTESYMLDKKLVSEAKLQSIQKAAKVFESIQSDTRFGSLCTSFDFLTESHIKIALEEQKLLHDRGDVQRLGDILYKAGMLSKGQRDLILIKQKANKKNKAEHKYDEKTIVAASDIDANDMRKIKSDGLLLLISSDLLTVYIKKTDDFDPDTSIDQFKKIISDMKIQHGVAEDDKLQIFLDSEHFTENYFTLAVGDEPLPGTDAVEKIYFSEEYKDPGKISSDGSIDYKERGDIPIARKDSVLAEKIPAKKGEAGLNVFDEFIPPAPPADFAFKHGKGTRISEDGLKVFAEVDGYPKRDAGGKIMIDEVFIIDGDVDYETGHVNYDKNVTISGTVKNGFKVNAIDIVVNEVDGGILYSKGNIFVKKGIINSTIYAKGSVSAGYISQSKIECFGDIEALKEISDSTILSDGECRVKTGKVFASSITAKRGIEIKDIGTEKAKRVSIVAGTSPNYNKQADKINRFIKASKDELARINSAANGTKNKIKKIDAAMSQISATTEKNQELLKTLYSRNNNETEILNLTLLEANEKLKNLETEKFETEQKLKQSQESKLKYRDLIKKSEKELELLKKAEQKTHPKPVVKIAGTIVSGTFVSGRYSKLIINKEKKRVKIMETKSTETGPALKNPWEMVISPLLD